MKLFRPALLVGLAAGLAAPAAAGELKLEIQNGRVTLQARDVPVRQILAEWARVGQTRIVNAEKVGGTPVTLQLAGVPEKQALDIILRSVSGYMAAPRPPGAAGASMYDRILVMATSVAPNAPPPTAQQPRAGFGPAFQQPFTPPVQQPVNPGLVPQPANPGFVSGQPILEDDQDDPVTPGPNPAVPQAVAPGFPPQPFPVMTPEPNKPYTSPSGLQGVPPSTANPWGVPAGTARVPGVITAPPNQPGQVPPNQPQPTRPPR